MEAASALREKADFDLANELDNAARVSILLEGIQKGGELRQSRNCNSFYTNNLGGTRPKIITSRVRFPVFRRKNLQKTEYKTNNVYLT